MYTKEKTLVMKAYYKITPRKKKAAPCHDMIESIVINGGMQNIAEGQNSAI